jgi:epoxyqueuosine reductase
VLWLKEKGYQAKWISPPKINYDPFPEEMVSYDPKTRSTPLPHKTAATQAGLGWIGKNALLVTREYGSAVRITTVLTDAELTTGKAIDRSECGQCNACVAVCPCHAPAGKNWHVGLHRDEFYDVFACRKTTLELARKAGINYSICGICIYACPWTQKYLKKFEVRGLKQEV